MFTSFSNTAARALVGTLGTALCAGLCLFGAAAPSRAATLDDGIRSRTVSTSGLDLSSVAGRAALDQRIRSAARSVCATGSREIAFRVVEVRCVRAAVEAARPRTVVTADAGIAG